MSHLDRLRDCSYTAPSGATFALDVREVRRELKRKASVHELPEQDEVIIQDLGDGASKFTLTAYIGGPDYDITADNFWTALAEKGPATLTHPRWGDVLVLPLSRVQSEGLVEGMRQAIFEIEFVRWQSIQWPTSSARVSAAIATAIASPTLPAIEAPTAAAVASIQSQAFDILGAINTAAAGAEWLTGAIEGGVNGFVASVNNVMNAPQALAENLIRLTSSPFRALSSAVSMVEGYVSLATQLASAAVSNYNAAVATITQIGCFFGAVGSLLQGSAPQNATEATRIADSLGTMSRDVLGQLEAQEAANPGFVVPLETAQEIKVAARLAIEAMLRASVSLPAEIRVTLTAERTPLELARELTGSPDGLDDIIRWNNLTGDELLIVPAGREVVYYG